MRHFDHIGAAERQRLFCVAPQPFHRDDDAAVLAVGLGATLYCPANRPTLTADIAKRVAQGVTSMVVCLEDAVADEDVAAAETNLVEQLRAFDTSGAEGPLLFVRIRRPDQIPDLVARLGNSAHVLSGFVLPKFTGESGAGYLDALADTAQASGLRLFGMPVIESKEAIHRESRAEVLLDVQRLLGKHRERILAVRIGATDLCSAYGLRRPRDVTIYDLRLVAEVIADVVNVLGRADESGFVVTGPVWEYFTGGERLFKPQLRESPFAEHDARALRAQLISRHLDGLIREVHLDKANGLTGKTVIHPTHVGAVHALSVVTHEEYVDATAILGDQASGGGVLRSEYANKMNEVKPHRAWASRILRRARVFGVAREDITFVDLLDAAVCS